MWNISWLHGLTTGCPAREHPSLMNNSHEQTSSSAAFPAVVCLAQRESQRKGGTERKTKKHRTSLWNNNKNKNKEKKTKKKNVERLRFKLCYVCVLGVNCQFNDGAKEGDDDRLVTSLSSVFFLLFYSRFIFLKLFVMCFFPFSCSFSIVLVWFSFPCYSFIFVFSCCLVSFYCIVLFSYSYGCFL